MESQTLEHVTAPPVEPVPLSDLSPAMQRLVALQHGELPHDTLVTFRDGYAILHGSAANRPVKLAPATVAPSPAAPVAQIRRTFEPRPMLDFVAGEVARPRWAVEGLWPLHAPGIIGGRPKAGKSTLSLELAVSLWSGTPMFNHPAFPSASREPVLYIQQENANSRVQRDLQAIMAARGLGTQRAESHWAEEHPGVPETAVEVWSDVFEPAPETAHLPAFGLLSHAGLDLSKREDVQWLAHHVQERGYRYVFLDPLYMLVGSVKVTDGGDELRPILTSLTAMGETLDCTFILTHHMSEKENAPLDASSLLGSTFIHGWYAAALMVAQDAGHSFRVKVDAQRDFGESRELVLQGLGVGSWFFAAEAQGQSDSVGRPAPRVAKKETNIARCMELHTAHPDWSYQEIADEVGVGLSTVKRYMTEAKKTDATPEVEEGSPEDAQA